MSLLTVFIPTAPERGTLLRNCLARLSIQTSDQFEVIVISDGRATELQELVAPFQARFRVHASHTEQRHRQWGHPQTEIAIRDMQGEWFVRVNDDNIIYPNFVGRILDAASNTNDQVIVWKVFLANTAYETGEPVVLPSELPPKYMGIDMLNFAVRRDLATSVGFPYRNFEADWDFLDECLRRASDHYHFIDLVLGEHW